MKKIILPVLLLLIGLVIAVGSQSFLGACVHDDGSFGACHWASRALMGEGALMALMALMALVLPGDRRGLCLAMAPVALLGFLTPGTLIDLCGMATMRCRMLMQPAMRILWAVALALALAGWLLERRRAR
ncbi:MAG: DUF4418 family protein [Clostridia bacterium]|nr:DUF4418 family protein [Clostridia bacterium]